MAQRLLASFQLVFVTLFKCCSMTKCKIKLYVGYNTIDFVYFGYFLWQFTCNYLQLCCQLSRVTTPRFQLYLLAMLCGQFTTNPRSGNISIASCSCGLGVSCLFSLVLLRFHYSVQLVSMGVGGYKIFSSLRQKHTQSQSLVHSHRTPIGDDDNHCDIDFDFSSCCI